MESRHGDSPQGHLRLCQLGKSAGTAVDSVYTGFESALLRVTTPEPGKMEDFIQILQNRLDERLEGISPDAPSLTDIISC